MFEREQEESKIIEEFVPAKKPKSRWRFFTFSFWIFLLVVLVVGVSSALVYKTGFTFSQMQTEKLEKLPLIEDLTTMNTPEPETDADRLNVLVLGLRGEGDPNGGLLTDSIMVVSLKKSTGQVALISIPRDLYITMPGQKYKEKINFAYALGYEQKGEAGGLYLSKIAVSRVTGLFIDHVVSVNHEAFKDVVDALGGITIILDKPFIEDQQWTNGGDLGSSSAFFIKTETASTSQGAVEKQKWVFKIPAGTSTLDGLTTLYYVRARYSSSDFDRTRRQQSILLAMKEKALSLGVLSNPVTIFQVLESLGKNVRTDLSFSEIKDLIGIASKVDTKTAIHKVFDTTPEGLLYSGKSDIGAYILSPVGDDFSKIQSTCKNIFQ